MSSPYPVYSPKWFAENISAPLFHVSIAFIVVQTIFVCLFLVARHLKKTLLSPDVLFILLGFVWNLLSITATLCMIHLGLGRHIAAIVAGNYPHLVTGLKFLLVQQFSYLFAAAFPKLAILYLYYQLFPTRIYRRLTCIIGSVVIAGLIGLCLGTFLICRPLAFNWNKALPGGKCGDLALLFKLVSLPNLITDIAILVLPIPMVWKLQMRTSQKVGLTVTFLTGSFGIVTAILRLYYFSTGNLFVDLTYNGIKTTCWTIVEPSCYLVAAILPSCRPILGMIQDSSMYASFKSSSKSSSSWNNSRRTGAASPVATRIPTNASDSSGMVKHLKDPSIEVTTEYYIEHVHSTEPAFVLDDYNKMWAHK